MISREYFRECFHIKSCIFTVHLKLFIGSTFSENLIEICKFCYGGVLLKDVYILFINFMQKQQHVYCLFVRFNFHQRIHKSAYKHQYL